MRNADFGFDRRAITSSPVVAGDKIIFGARDGFLYALDGNDGHIRWKVDHTVSWVISTVAVKDSIVITGTSDGRFVQAVNLETGKELWKYRTPNAVWSSPLIINNKVYTGTFDGQLYCLDLLSGARVSQFRTNGKILSSPVWAEDHVFFGSDDGFVYSLKGRQDEDNAMSGTCKYVYFENGNNVYFRNGSDQHVRNYLRSHGYKVLNADSLAYFMRTNVSPGVIVFASCYFPASVISDGSNSLLRQYLDRGGRIVLTGTNPLLYQIDEKSHQPFAFRPGAPDSILNIDYGPGDTRTFKGDIPSFPTDAGKWLGLPEFWSSSVFLDKKQVDVSLGENENGDVSAFIKRYSNGGLLIQIWLDPDRPDRLDAVLKAAEWSFP